MPMFFYSRNVQVTLKEKPTLKIIVFKLIYVDILIILDQTDKGYRCESDKTITAWRVN